MCLALAAASGLTLAVVAYAAAPGHTDPAPAQAVGNVAVSTASSQSAEASSSITPADGAADPAKAIVERVCQSCHDIGVLSQTPHTADEWPAIVQRMRSNGADLNSAQAKLVVTYLQNNYVAKP